MQILGSGVRWQGMKKGLRFLTLVALALWVIPGNLDAQTFLKNLKTRPERTNYIETSRYEDVMAFLEAVDAASPSVRLTTMGYSYEGRALPLAVVGNVGSATPEAVRASGKVRVYVQGDIHAGEVEGKEAVLEILRAVAEGKHSSWFKSIILLVCPIYNADGNERVNLLNRGPQHGPLGGMGQRESAQGYDLNRDHMKIDSPEARSLIRFLTLYDPHIFIDLHTTDGTRHAYHLTYETPLHPNVSPGLIDLLRKDLLPAVSKVLRATEGWETFYYGNAWGGRQGGERAWYTTEPTPRYSQNYAGFRNRLGILCETYSYLTFQDRIRASRRFVEEVMDYVERHAAQVKKSTADADCQSIVGTPMALSAKAVRAPEPVEILMGETAEERNPYSGARILRRLDVVRPERMAWFGTFEPGETITAPRAYLVPPSLQRVVDRLAAHGIRTQTLKDTLTLEAEQFRLDSTTVAEREYQGHKQRILYGEWRRSEAVIPAGTLVVPLDQPLARLAFQLLEPRAEDCLASWNLMDDAIERGKGYPILRVFGEIADQTSR
jgi:hypothetical protein